MGIIILVEVLGLFKCLWRVLSMRRAKYYWNSVSSCWVGDGIVMWVCVSVRLGQCWKCAQLWAGCACVGFTLLPSAFLSRFWSTNDSPWATETSLLEHCLFYNEYTAKTTSFLAPSYLNWFLLLQQLSFVSRFSAIFTTCELRFKFHLIPNRCLAWALGKGCVVAW